MSRPAALGVALLVPVLLAACAGEPDEVRIGLVAALTGPHAVFGVDVERGARMAVDELNEAGGIDGRPVRLLVRDVSDPGTASSRMAELVDRRGVVAVIGPETSGAVLGERNPLAGRGVAALLPTAFAGELSGVEPPVFRTVPRARDQAAAIGRWLADERGLTTVALLVADPVEGDDAQDDLRDGLAAAGVEIVGSVVADGDAPDLGPAVARLRRDATDADAIFVWAPPAPAARATRAIRSQGWDAQIAVPTSGFAGAYRSLAGEASEGVVLPFPFREEWFGAPLERWLLRWHERHGLDALADLETLVLDLPVAGIASYDAVGVVATAVAAAGTTDPREVARALAETAHDGLLRTYGFDAGEAWDVDELHIARFHHLAVIYDVDARLDEAWQRRFYEAQVRLDYIPESLLRGPAGEVVRDLLAQRRARAPAYEPPLPPPGPVARPATD